MQPISHSTDASLPLCGLCFAIGLLSNKNEVWLINNDNQWEEDEESLDTRVLDFPQILQRSFRAVQGHLLCGLQALQPLQEQDPNSRLPLPNKKLTPLKQS